MKASSLQLESSAVTRLHIEANKELKDPALNFIEFAEAGLSSTVETGKNQDEPHRHVVRLEVKLPGTEQQATPYVLDIEIYGIFRCVSEDHDKDDIMLAYNAPAVLYGSVRELVMLVTSRGPYSPLVLPTVNFIADDTNVTPDGKISEQKLP